jgi:HD superfamily phosphohydrolase
MSTPNLTDFELMEALKISGGYCREIALMLKHRRIFKTAYYKRPAELTEEQSEKVNELAQDVNKHRDLELTICERAGVPEGHVIIDIPATEITDSDARITRTDVKILDDNNKVGHLSEYSTLTAGLQLRGVTDWAIMAVTDAQYVPTVSRVIERELFRLIQ